MAIVVLYLAKQVFYVDKQFSFERSYPWLTVSTLQNFLRDLLREASKSQEVTEDKLIEYTDTMVRFQYMDSVVRSLEFWKCSGQTKTLCFSHILIQELFGQSKIFCIFSFEIIVDSPIGELNSDEVKLCKKIQNSGLLLLPKHSLSDQGRGGMAENLLKTQIPILQRTTDSVGMHTFFWKSVLPKLPA